MNRRTFLKVAGLLAGGLAASSMLPDIATGAPKPQSRRAQRTFNADASRPNILVILVDQLRYPQGQFTQALMDQAAPRLAELRGDSVSFGHHCAAANSGPRYPSSHGWAARGSAGGGSRKGVGSGE